MHTLGNINYILFFCPFKMHWMFYCFPVLDGGDVAHLKSAEKDPSCYVDRNKAHCASISFSSQDLPGKNCTFCYFKASRLL